MLIESTAFLLCGYAALLCLPDLYLIAVHALKQRRSAGERAVNAEIPGVCVQLPVHNERESIAAAIDSLCRLDWPRTKLEITILDDSTDGTTAVAAERVAHWLHQGLDIRLIHRPHRRDFKAGALAAALELTEMEFVAIFDVDYRPAPDFLQKVTPILVADPRAAFVQARLDHRNRGQNLLTRAQALELDMYLGYEQAGRGAAGIPTPFNGTCGVWRRAAIVDAGGWSGRTLVEDLDLSLRAFERGWRSLILTPVAVAGELPDSFDTLVTQRRRWATGTGQAFHAVPWRLLRHLNWHQALVFILLVQFHAAFMPTLVLMALAVTLCWMFGTPNALAASFALAGVVMAIVVLKSVGAAVAQHLVGRLRWRRFLVDLAAMWLLEAALVPIVAASLTEGLLRRKKPFARTPKRGAG